MHLIWIVSDTIYVGGLDTKYVILQKPGLTQVLTITPPAERPRDLGEFAALPRKHYALNRPDDRDKLYRDFYELWSKAARPEESH